MEYGPPPLFNQGVPARARLVFFALLAVALIVVDARVKALETMRTGVGVALYPLQRVMLFPGTVIDSVGEYFTSIDRLMRENDSLKREALERSQLLEEAAQLRAENARLRSLLGARERLGNGGIVGQVLYESRDRFTRKLVLDKGINDGVRAGHPVIDDTGVVGQVTRVFPATSEVTLLTDKDQAIPVQILRNGLRGIAFGGAEPETLDLKFMAVNADIVQGDSVVTSGLDGVYPPGLPVATVERVERNVREQFARVVMTPAGAVRSHVHLLVLLTDASRLPPAPEADARSQPPPGPGRAASAGRGAAASDHARKAGSGGAH
jgi:rod shape-determining protein MreC